MRKRADQTAAAVQLQVAGRPDRRGADVAGEHGVVCGRVTDDLGEILRVDRLMTGVADREIVERLARLGVFGQTVIEMDAVLLRLEPRQQRRDRGADIADQTEVDRAAAAQVFRP